MPEPDYVDKLYGIMSDAYGSAFTHTPQTFREKITTDSNYTAKVFDIMKEGYGESFTHTNESFYDKVGLKKKDNSQYGSDISTSPSDIAKDVVGQKIVKNTPKTPTDPLGKENLTNIDKGITDFDSKPPKNTPQQIVEKFIGKDGIKQQSIVENLSKQGDYELSNKVIEQLPQQTAYTYELSSFNNKKLAEQAFTKGQTKEAQEYLKLAKQQLDDAEKLYTTTKTQRPLLYQSRAEINLISGNYLAAIDDAEKVKTTTANNTQLQGMDAGDLYGQKLNAERNRYSEQIKYNALAKLKVPEEVLQEQDKNVQQSANQLEEVSKFVRYKEWLPYTQSKDFTAGLASAMGNPFPMTVSGLEQGITKVVTNVSDLANTGGLQRISMGMATDEDIADVVGVINGTAGAFFATMMTATPSGAYMNLVFNAAETILQPIGGSHIIMGTPSWVYQKLGGELKHEGDLKSEAYEFADLVWMTVLFAGVHGVKTGAWKDPKTIEMAQTIVEKIKRGEELKPFEADEMYRWIEMTPPEVKLDAVNFWKREKLGFKEKLGAEFGEKTATDNAVKSDIESKKPLTPEEQVQLEAYRERGKTPEDALTFEENQQYRELLERNKELSPPEEVKSEIPIKPEPVPETKPVTETPVEQTITNPSEVQKSKTAYHGTSKEFSELKAYEDIKNPEYKEMNGVHLTSSKQSAQRFGKNIHEIDIGRLKLLDASDKTRIEFAVDWLMKNKNLSKTEALDLVRKEKTYKSTYDMILDKIDSGGYDGIKLNNEYKDGNFDYWITKNGLEKTKLRQNDTKIAKTQSTETPVEAEYSLNQNELNAVKALEEGKRVVTFNEMDEIPIEIKDAKELIDASKKGFTDFEIVSDKDLSGKDVQQYSEIIKRSVKNANDIPATTKAEPVEPVVETPTENPLSQFETIVKESKSLDEAFKKVTEIKDIPIQKSKEFREKYDPENNLTPKQAFEKFYNEVKGEKVKAPEEPLPIYKGGKTGEATGAFNNIENKEIYTGIEELNPIEFPELLRLARNLLTSVKVKKLKLNTMGRFIFNKNGRRIELNPDLLKDGNEGQLAKTIAHEIGHLSNIIPENIEGGKGILGKIASIKDYLGKRLPFKKGDIGDLSKVDYDRLELDAKNRSKKQYVEKIIDEEIEKTTPITPSDVLDIWNSVGKSLNKNLYDYIAQLDVASKKSIVLQAMKGFVPKDLQRFAEIIKVKTGKQITIQQVIKGDWKKKFKELIEEEVKKRKLFDEKQIRDELIALSEWWRPYDKIKSDKKYTKYRESADELYADAISVLLNDPQALSTKAPNFFKAFFNYLAEKPELQENYIQLQQLLNSGRENVIRERINSQVDASKKSIEIFNKKQDAREKNRRWLNIRQLFIKQYISQHSAVFNKIAKEIGYKDAKHITRDVTELEKVINSAEQMAYLSNDQIVYSRKMVDILNRLDDSGLLYENFESYIKNKKLAFTELYDGKARPEGITKSAAAENLKVLENDIRNYYGDRAWETLEKAAQDFYDANWEIMQQGIKDGRFSPELVETIKNEKGWYATFMPLDKVAEYDITASISNIIGTFEKTADTFVFTQMKMNAIMHGIAKNKAIKSLIDFSGDYFKEAKPFVSESGGKVRKTFPDTATEKALTYIENGKTKAVYVPKDVYEIYTGGGMPELGVITSALNVSTFIFKNLVTKYRPKFALGTNPIRDIMSSVRLITVIKMSMEGKTGGQSVVELFKTTADIVKNMPYTRMAARYAVSGKRGFIAKAMGIDETILKEFINEAIKEKSLPLQTGIRTLYEGKETEYDAIIDTIDPKRKRGLDYKTSKLENTKLLKWYVDKGQANEMWSKFLGYKVLKEAGFTKEKAAYLTRNYSGTPNFLVGGTHRRVAGSYMPFYNVLVNAMRREYSLATSKQSAAAYWITTITQVGTPAVLTGLAASGVFGDKLKEAYAKTSNYLASNFLSIPIMELEDGSILNITLPLNDVERVLYSTIHNATKTIVSEDEKFRASDILEALYKGSELSPSLHPLLEVAAAAGVIFGAGGNWYDSFKKKKVIKEGTMSRDDTGEKIIEFAKWSTESLGFDYVTRMFNYNGDDKKPTTEYVVKNIPIVNAIVRVPGDGISQNILDRHKKEEVPLKEYKQEKFNIAKRYAEDYEMSDDYTTVVIEFDKK